MLTSERLTDWGGGATFYSSLVQVEDAEIKLSRRSRLIIFIVVAVTPYCRRKTARVETVEEDNSQLASVVQTNDAKASLQLVKGFMRLSKALGGGPRDSFR